MYETVNLAKTLASGESANQSFSPKQDLPLVLIAEDLAALRNYAAELLRKMFKGELQILEALDASDCAHKALEHVPDLIVMNVDLPDKSGIKAAQIIWESLPSMKILFWSRCSREIHIRDLQKILPDEAVHGYLLKGESDEKFEYAVNCLLKHNNTYTDPAVRSITSKLGRKDELFSDIEYETLLDICLGLTDKAIARRRKVSVRGVQNRVSVLEAKLLKGQNVVARENSGLEVYNTRSRAVFEAFRRGLIDQDTLDQLDREMREWMAAELHDKT